MDDLLRRPKSIRMLRELHARGPMNQRTFAFVAEMAPTTAQTLREEMARLGLVSVGRPAVRSGTTDIEIRLTPEGEEIARLLLKVDPILEHAKEKGEDG